VEGQIYDVLIKEIDLAPMGTKVNEIDFQELVSDKKVHSVAEIILENIDKVAEGVVQESLKEVAYKAYPSALVEKIRVDVSHMKIGDVIRVRDLEIAEDQDVELKTSLDAVVASVLAVHNNIESTDEETEDTTLETV
ncbi:MAG: 50S ribosomal protein L25, partial [Eubacteriales bacterium]|nr:50S ribosomal protein L25 [Eubacteriales bacterium]